MLKNILILLSIILFAASVSIANAQNLLYEPESVAFDSVFNRYLVSCWNGSKIVQIDSNGVQSVFKDGIGTCRGNHIHDGVLYVSTTSALVGIDLVTTDIVLDVGLPAVGFLDGVAVDSSGYVYVVDTRGKIFKIRISDQTYSIFVDSGLPSRPQDIFFDDRHNRLLLVAFTVSPILAIDLVDSTISTVVPAILGNYDGITMDQFGNTFVATYANNGCVLKYDSSFTIPPEEISSGHDGPAGLDYNRRDHIIAVPNFYANTVDFIDLKTRIIADTLWGQVPLEVNFEGRSVFEDVENWLWDFGDSSSATGQFAVHTFSNYGQFNVSLEIEVNGETYSYTETGFISALADSLIAPDVQGEAGSTVEVAIYARNTLPINRFSVPVEYPGLLNIALDSFSTNGCRTNYFDNAIQSHSNPVQWQARFLVYNDPGGSTPDLEPGVGPILKLYFTIPPSAVFGRTSSIILDGYSSYIPEFEGPVLSFSPVCIEGTVSLPGICGDANGDGNVNILDITFLIAYKYLEGPEPENLQICDVNNDGGVNILDITYLIAYKYLGGPEPNCM